MSIDTNDVSRFIEHYSAALVRVNALVVITDGDAKQHYTELAEEIANDIDLLREFETGEIGNLRPETVAESWSITRQSIAFDDECPYCDDGHMDVEVSDNELRMIGVTMMTVFCPVCETGVTLQHEAEMTGFDEWERMNR